MKFTEKRNWNGATAVYFSEKFIGQFTCFSENWVEFTQFSHNKNQIFDLNLSIEYMKSKTDKLLTTRNNLSIANRTGFA